MSNISIGFKRKREEIAVSETSAPSVFVTAGLETRDYTSTVLYDANDNIIETITGDIPYYEFQDRTDIVRVEGGTNTLSIGVYAFRNCINLLSISFPSVFFIEIGAFSGCTSLNAINLPSVNVIHDSCFNNCFNLKTINLPKATRIGEIAFKDCTSLSDINLPKVTSIDKASFYGCTSLSSAFIPSATSIGRLGPAFPFDGAFAGCSFSTISLPSVTALGNFTFFYCSNLTNIRLNVNYANIGQSVFANAGLNTIQLRPAPNTPIGWLIGPGQTISGKSNITVVNNWTSWPD